MHGWLYARYLMIFLQVRQWVLLCFLNLVGDHGDLVTRSNLDLKSLRAEDGSGVVHPPGCGITLRSTTLKLVQRSRF